MAKPRNPTRTMKARTPTGKQASPDARARAEQESLEGLKERTKEGHRKAGRAPDETEMVSSGARSVRRVELRLIDLWNKSAQSPDERKDRQRRDVDDHGDRRTPQTDL